MNAQFTHCFVCGHKLIASYCLNPRCEDFNPTESDLNLLDALSSLVKKEDE